MRAAGAAGVRSPSDAYIPRDAATEALIALIADVVWAERQHAGEARLQRMRDEAVTLLARVQQGDRAAARRAMELVSATGGRSA